MFDAARSGKLKFVVRLTSASLRAASSSLETTSAPLTLLELREVANSLGTDLELWSCLRDACDGEQRHFRCVHTDKRWDYARSGRHSTRARSCRGVTRSAAVQESFIECGT
jgi:hypothetical protein